LRAVTAATAADILELGQKSFDNLLLRIGPDAIAPGRQGMERRIPVALIEDLLLTRELSSGLAIPTRDAFQLARRLLGRSPGTGRPDLRVAFVGSLHIGEFIQLGTDVTALRHRVQARLEGAVETVVRRRRGRPRRTVSGQAGG
jgi:hypothetical protein